MNDFVILSEYFKFDHVSRRKEVLDSIRDNSLLNEVHRIILFHEEISEDEQKLLVDIPKVELVRVNHRCRYSDLFSYANTHLQNEICIVCNNDISFTDSLGHLIGSEMDELFLCLTRWDIKDDGSICLKEPRQSRKHSQDSWVFKSPLPQKMIDKGTIFFGRPGCDNMIAYLAVVSGLKVLNPSELIVSVHRHLSGKRNYKQNERGTPASNEKFGHHSLYMNVGTSNSIEYNTENLVYKLQQAWKPRNKVFGGDLAVEKCVELEDALEEIWEQSVSRVKF